MNHPDLQSTRYILTAHYPQQSNVLEDRFCYLSMYTYVRM